MLARVRVEKMLRFLGAPAGYDWRAYYNAYGAGRVARTQGRRAEANPYLRDRILNDAWARGWVDRDYIARNSVE